MRPGTPAKPPLPPNRSRSGGGSKSDRARVTPNRRVEVCWSASCPALDRPRSIALHTAAPSTTAGECRLGCFSSSRRLGRRQWTYPGRMATPAHGPSVAGRPDILPAECSSPRIIIGCVVRRAAVFLPFFLAISLLPSFGYIFYSSEA